MYIPLILFFLSFAGIIIMLSRELVLIRNGKVAHTEHSHPFVAELQTIRELTLQSGKKLGYLAVFMTLKFFIKSSNSLKNISKGVMEELKKDFEGNLNETNEKREPSKYLKIISEYQQKIRRMKHKIKEEEGIE